MALELSSTSAVGLDGTWGPFGATGLFAATVVRASLYTTMPRDQGVEGVLGEPVSAPIPGRYAAEPTFNVTEPEGVSTTVAPVRLPSATLLSLPSQQRAGVIKVRTDDSASVMTIALNGPVAESLLDYYSESEWRKGVEEFVGGSVVVEATEPGRDMSETVNKARVGSELWPLFIVLAVLCAVAESLVGRFMAQDTGAATSP